MISCKKIGRLNYYTLNELTFAVLIKSSILKKTVSNAVTVEIL